MIILYSIFLIFNLYIYTICICNFIIHSNHNVYSIIYYIMLFDYFYNPNFFHPIECLCIYLKVLFYIYIIHFHHPIT